MLKNLKIRTRIIIGFLIVVFSIGIGGYISIIISQDYFKDLIGENAVFWSQQVIDNIDRNIENRIEEIENYTIDSILQKYVVDSNQEFEKLNDIQAYINEQDNIWKATSNNEITPFIKELITNELAEGMSEKVKFYENKYKYSLFGEIFVTNKYGANIAQTKKTSDYYQADEEWWQRAKEIGLYVQDIEYDESAEIYSIAICIRINDNDGNFIGVIKASLNIQETIDIIKEIDPMVDSKLMEEHKLHGHESHKTMEFMLINKDGKLIFFTGEGSDILEDVSENLLSELKGEDSYFIKSEKLFGNAYSSGYRNYEGLGWILFIEHETKEVFEIIPRIRNILLILSLIIVVIATAIGFLVSSSISKPLKILQDSVKVIEQGNLGYNVPINSKDEIGKLADSFNKMSSSLQKNRANIEKKVKERTQQLEKLNSFMVGRELKMAELKKEIQKLKKNKSQVSKSNLPKNKKEK